MNIIFNELKTKEIIRINTGERIGFVNDLEIDCDSGAIKSLIVHGAYRGFGLFGKDEDTYISWDKIEKIGTDFIVIK